MYATTIGTAVFFVFATQADVLRTWCFWMSDPPPETVYLPRETNWCHTLDVTKSVEQEMEREWSIAWGEVARPPGNVVREWDCVRGRVFKGITFILHCHTR